MNTYKLSIEEAEVAEASLPAGIYQIQFDMTGPVDLDQARQQLAASGAKVTNIKQWESNDVWHLLVEFVKPDNGISCNCDRISQLAAASIINALVPIVAASVIGISIFKIGEITTGIGNVLLIAGAVLILGIAVLKRGSVRAGQFEIKKE